MMEKQRYPDWLTEFVKHAEYGEAPQYVYFWVGIATIAAALRRQVWIDQKTFCWYPNLYTLFVAPPGIIAKSTSTALGMKLLEDMPGMHFSSSTITWQALYDAFLGVGEEFEWENKVFRQHPLIIHSSEFGTTLNPQDTEMIDQLVHIWDGGRMSKHTRKDGEIIVKEPCLNIIACTTPDWIAGNVPQYLIGGGLTSRMLFIYADKKVRYVPYPDDIIPPGYDIWRKSLSHDLEIISSLKGEFLITPEARAWGGNWYSYFFEHEARKLDATLLGGYIARKQTLSHKVAMCLAASQGSMIITAPILERAVLLVTELEKHMPFVYSKIGMEAGANAAQQVLAYLDQYGGEAPFDLLYRYMHKKYPDPMEFEKILGGMLDAKYITIDKSARTVKKI